MEFVIISVLTGLFSCVTQDYIEEMGFKAWFFWQVLCFVFVGMIVSWFI